MWSDAEECEGFLFRYRDCGSAMTRSDKRFQAAAKLVFQPFASDTIVGEPAHHDVWFDYGATAEEAVRKLKAELLPSSQKPVLINVRTEGALG